MFAWFHFHLELRYGLMMCLAPNNQVPLSLYFKILHNYQLLVYLYVQTLFMLFLFYTVVYFLIHLNCFFLYMLFPLHAIWPSGKLWLVINLYWTCLAFYMLSIIALKLGLWILFHPKLSVIFQNYASDVIWILGRVSGTCWYHSFCDFYFKF